ncbi:type II 3-dehydroquinate dehydratase [Brevundimonas sp.]|uniref:type II 3-dehydroquinate dehydratase n=1 Tax=Brevundimonas sp. TaxID=1871086 RepID=UPI002FDA804D
MPEALALYVLNGPNLNLLGVREPEIYGSKTLDDVRAICEAAAGGVRVEFRQSNHEGVLIDWIQEARTAALALIINPAAYGHTSIALLDALKTLTIPVVECHLSDPTTREAFRHHSYVSLAADDIITGQGAQGYAAAVRSALKLVQERAAA